MYKNLEVEMTRYGIGIKDIANCIGVSEEVMSSYLSRTSLITWEDAQKIKHKLFSQYKIEYLFAKQMLPAKKSEGNEVQRYYTISEVAKRLNIGKSTIYHNGPASYGGVKIGGSWRFPEDRIGVGPEAAPKQVNAGYVRRFGKNAGKKVGP
jgi:excisionase family DNA binding protein